MAPLAPTVGEPGVRVVLEDQRAQHHRDAGHDRYVILVQEIHVPSTRSLIPVEAQDVFATVNDSRLGVIRNRPIDRGRYGEVGH